MKHFFRVSFYAIAFFSMSAVINSCTKGSGTIGPNPCNGVVITVIGTVINPSGPGANDGRISSTVATAGNFTYSINNGPFQATGDFSNLATDSYIITAKNADGCTGSATFRLSSLGPVCTGITINVSATTTSNTFCPSNNGSITITASGGTANYTYSLNGSSFQASNSFTGLNGGTYLVTAKDANGCTGNANITVTNATAGPLFTAVKTLIQNNCATVGCHADVQTPILTNQCSIITNKTLIKTRAVDGTPTPMPATGLLSVSERQKITDWINAGGLFTN